uniref:HTH CENPB-type domain-containing protein n=1 Tax=Hyaloperonospora arabidopsidis (strain Emoy2) TaxID=559515 RepID=M4BQK6_HYAAE
MWSTSRRDLLPDDGINFSHGWLQKFQQCHKPRGDEQRGTAIARRCESANE